MAASLNKVLLMGNLTRDPELKFTPNGKAVCDLGMAINDSYKAQDGTIKETVTYVDVEVWGRTAENCKQYLAKGRPVFVEGQLKLDQWEKDGKKYSRLKVRGERIQFLGGGQRTEGGAAPQRPASGQAAPQPASGERPPPSDEDDIPF